MLSSQVTGDSQVITPIRVVGTRIYRGPHLYSQTPMIQITLDLGELENWPTNQLEGFATKLVSALPGLQKHGCSYGEEGGFIRRMEEGTWLGHVVEHVALELQTVAGQRVTRGKTRSVKGRPCVYHVMYSYLDEEVGVAAGRLALELVESLLPQDLRGFENLDEICGGPEKHSFAEGLTALKDEAASRALGPTTASLVHEAERRGIPFSRIDHTSLIVFGHGCKQKRIRASCSDLTSEIATGIAGDKDLTKLLLDRAGLPVPRRELVRSADEACSAASRLGYPVVIRDR